MVVYIIFGTLNRLLFFFTHRRRWVSGDGDWLAVTFFRGQRDCGHFRRKLPDLPYLTLFPLMRYAYDANSLTNIPRLKLDGWMKAKEGTKDT
jgi:hypothetical protein